MNNLSVQRLINTIEFRGLNSLKKAVKLVQEHEISQRQAATVCKVKRRAVQRALKASKEGRDIGVPGRPKLFTREEEEELIEIVDKAELEQKPLTFKQLQEKVNHNLFSSITFYHTFTHILTFCKAREIYLNTSGRNLTQPTPIFTRTYLKNLLSKYDFKMRWAKTLEPVCIYMHYLSIVDMLTIY
jgi:transposase